MVFSGVRVPGFTAVCAAEVTGSLMLRSFRVEESCMRAIIRVLRKFVKRGDKYGPENTQGIK